MQAAGTLAGTPGGLGFLLSPPAFPALGPMNQQLLDSGPSLPRSQTQLLNTLPPTGSATPTPETQQLPLDFQLDFNVPERPGRRGRAPAGRPHAARLARQPRLVWASPQWLPDLPAPLEPHGRHLRPPSGPAPERRAVLILTALLTPTSSYAVPRPQGAFRLLMALLNTSSGTLPPEPEEPFLCAPRTGTLQSTSPTE